MLSQGTPIYYKPNLYSHAAELQVFEALQNLAEKKCLAARYSEYINLQSYTIRKSVHQCRVFYKGNVVPAFEFAVCLN
jgi:hypothetical protein